MMSTMMNTMKYLRNRFSSKKGQGMVEYGLILAALAVIVVGCIVFLQEPLEDFFQGIGDYMSGQIPAGGS
jgi:pilus assembly protein Flp/PilA